jgi:peptidoglycan/LPS O-acetylase OafA/YrhL
MSHFVVGLIIADWSQSGYFRAYISRRYSWILSWVLLCIVCFITLHGPYTYGKQFDEYLRQIVIKADGKHGASLEFWESNLSFLILCTAMMLFVEVSPMTQAFFGLKPFVYLGRISFALYLFHPTFIETIGMWLMFKVGYQSKSQCHWISFYAGVINIVIAEFLTRIVDVPSIFVARYIEQGFINGNWSINIPTVRHFSRILFNSCNGVYLFFSYPFRLYSRLFKEKYHSYELVDSKA